MPPPNYADNVFINCPFDAAYKPLFYAIVFAVFDCGYVARSAQESDDAGEVRVEKIIRIIKESKYGIHDISRTELSPGSGLPRFNMPLELGLFLGAKRYGGRDQKAKTCLILDSIPHRYQASISDIAGQDVRTHGDDPRAVIPHVRNWLNDASGRTTIPGGAEILRRYELFQDDLPAMCAAVKVEIEELTFVDYATFVTEWLRGNS